MRPALLALSQPASQPDTWTAASTGSAAPILAASDHGRCRWRACGATAGCLLGAKRRLDWHLETKKFDYAKISDFVSKFYQCAQTRCFANFLDVR
jgi:hypothetical protein